MKKVHSTTIRLDDEVYKRVKESTHRLGISMNELISILLSMDLPIDVSDLAAYHYMKAMEKFGGSHDIGTD